MKLEWSDKVLLLIIAATAIVTGIVYDSLSAQLPVHWGFRGEVDRFADRWFIWIMALLPALILFLMLIAPKIDPRGERYEQHQTSYRLTRVGSVLLLVGVHWIILLSGLGYDLSVGLLTKGGVGLLFMVMGAGLSKVRPNFTFGIRLPWTLADDEVWRKTHLLGGVLFVLVGLSFLAMAPLSGALSFVLTLALLLVSLVVVAVYAYPLYNRRNK